MFLFFFLFFSELLLCSFFRFEEWFKVKNCLTTSLLFSFYFENHILKISKIWVGRTTLNGENEEDGKRKESKEERNFEKERDKDLTFLKAFKKNRQFSWVSQKSGWYKIFSFFSLPYNFKEISLRGMGNNYVLQR